LKGEEVIGGCVGSGWPRFETGEDGKGPRVGLVGLGEAAKENGIHGGVGKVDWTLVHHLQSVVQVDIGLSDIPELEEVSIGIDQLGAVSVDIVGDGF
jgi:hypothetical protein